MRARVFKTGRSQAVHIPAQFRFSAPEVEIRREPNGDLVLSQRPDWNEIWRMCDAVDWSDTLEHRDDEAPQTREEW